MINILHLFKKPLFPLGFLAVFLMGWQLGRPPESESTASEEETVAVWTCSMHPQVRRTGPGLCPICHMDADPWHDGTRRSPDSIDRHAAIG